MKKSTIILATILLFPAAVALARGGGEPSGADFGGHDSGGGGGNSNNAGGNGGGGNGTVDNSTDTSTHLKDRGDVNRSTGGTAPNRGYGRNGSNNSRPKGTNGSFHHFNSFNGRNAYQPAGTSNGLHHFQSIPQSLRRMGVTSVPRPRAESTLLSHNLQHSTPGLPSQGACGRPFSGSMVSPRLMNSPAVKSQMAALAGNKGFNPKIGPPQLGEGPTNIFGTVGTATTTAIITTVTEMGGGVGTAGPGSSGPNIIAATGGGMTPGGAIGVIGGAAIGGGKTPGPPRFTFITTAVTHQPIRKTRTTTAARFTATTRPRASRPLITGIPSRSSKPRRMRTGRWILSAGTAKSRLRLPRRATPSFTT